MRKQLPVTFVIDLNALISVVIRLTILGAFIALMIFMHELDLQERGSKAAWLPTLKCQVNKP